MIWPVRLEDQLINDLDIEDEELLEEAKNEFNRVRDEAVNHIAFSRKTLREQRGEPRPADS